MFASVSFFKTFPFNHPVSLHETSPSSLNPKSAIPPSLRVVIQYDNNNDEGDNDVDDYDKDFEG